MLPYIEDLVDTSRAYKRMITDIKRDFELQVQPNFKKIDKFDKTIVCYKCGRAGHIARNCHVKERIKQLTMNDELKEQISSILLYDSGSYSKK